MIDIRIAKNKEEIRNILEIRKEVFIKGQNIPIEREKDGLDNSSKHVIVYWHDKPVGCARIRYKNKDMKLERIAIIKEMQGKGFGKQLMKFLINYAKNKKFKEVHMLAQYYLLDFYREFGFKQRGDIVYDAGIKHIEMYLKI